MREPIINIFKKAISNEMYIDSLENLRFDTKNILGFKIIKPSVLTSLLKKNIFFRLCLRLILFLWLPIGLFIIIFHLIKSFVIYTRSSKKSINNINVAMLMFSHRLQDLRNQLNFQELEVVNIYLKENNDSNEGYSIYQLTKIKYILRSFVLSVKLHFSICMDQSLQSYEKLNSLFGFDWFLVYITLKNISIKNVVFCNHYDRWAVLFDHLKSNKELIQHGLLSDKVFPPTKLNTVAHLHVYNSLEENIFLKNVINNTPIVSYLKPMIVLKEIIMESIKPRVLFISCLPITFDDEIKLLKLLSKYDLELIVKPHPVYSDAQYVKLSEDIKFHLISNKALFPSVDLVVSYKSTLAYEYELCGINVVYYESFVSHKELLNGILDKLNLL